jgi:NADH dehydrogenase
MSRKKLWFALGAAAGVGLVAAAAHRRRQAARELETVVRLRAAEAPRGRNIVVLGAGFGGIHTTAGLLRRIPADSGWTVTLVDRPNYFLFTPLLYHAATGLVDPSNILFPVRSLSRDPHFVFREARVEGIDFEGRTVRLDDGELPYDVLVVALGSVTNFFGQDEALRDALTLKNVADGIGIRNRIIDAFERADITRDPEERRRCLTFVVVGGGATGVELIGAIRGLVHGTLPRQYPRIRPEEVRLVLFEAHEQILSTLPSEMATRAQRRLRELGIEVRTGVRVAHVTADGAETEAGERVPARTVVWAAGIRPVPLADTLDVAHARGGRLEVDDYFEIPGRPGVYAIGDVAAMHDRGTGGLLPPSAAVACQQGDALAEILTDRLAGREARPFRYRHRGELVSLGRHEAVAEVFGRRLTGFPAWVVWRVFYLSQLLGFKNRVSVALDWSFAYFYQRETVRLDV